MNIIVTDTNEKTENRERIYRQFLLAMFIVLLLVLSYIRLREADSFFAASSDAGYPEEYQEIDGNAVLAEGMEQVNLYPGTYELTIDAKTESDATLFQVVDRWNHTLLAEHVYTPGEEYHTVRFTTDHICRDVVVRSILTGADVRECLNDDGNTEEQDRILRIYGYTMSSDGPVCSDAKWEILLFGVFLLLLFAGIHRAVYQKKRADLFLFLISSCASLPFLSEFLPRGHDLGFHTARILSIGLSIQEHLIPQRLTAALGGDSIIPIMYPELFLTGAGYMVATGATVFLAYKVTCVFITFLTAYVAYYAVRLESSEKTALLFATIYLLNPYRLNELFLRAAVGEAFGMAFLPLILIGMWELMHDSEAKGAGLLLLGFTGLLNSHIVLMIISALFCVLYFAMELILHPKRILKRWKIFTWILGAGVATVVLNAWFLIPFLKFYGTDFLVSSGNYLNAVESTTPYLWQIFMGEGEYGNNNPGNSARGEMSLTVGPALLIGLLGFVLLYLVDESKKVHGDECILSVRERNCGKKCFFMGGVAIFLCSPYFPWTYLNERMAVWGNTLGRIQFSWRLLTYVAVLFSLGTAITVQAVLRQQRTFAGICAGLILLLVIVSGINTATLYYSNPEYMDNRYDEKLATNYDYTFADVTKEHSYEIKTWIESGKGPESPEEESSLRIVDYRRDGVNYWFSYEKEEGEEVQVTMPVFWYGLHKAYWADGTGSAAAGNSEEIAASMNEDNQFTVVTLPAGSTEGEVVLQYEEPLLFRIGNWISIVSVAGLVLAAVGRKVAFPRKRKVRKIQ